MRVRVAVIKTCSTREFRQVGIDDTPGGATKNNSLLTQKQKDPAPRDLKVLIMFNITPHRLAMKM
jgi:hypothetical protein